MTAQLKPGVTQLKIEKLVYGGEGLSRTDGEVVFTPFVLPGELVEAHRSGARRQAERASLVRVIEPAPERVDPACPYFFRCGGCQYQHASYEAQVRFKRSILVETLRRAGKIEFDAERVQVIAGEPYGYRNRSQFHIENGRIGYRERHSHKLVPIEECPISSPKVNEVIRALNRLIRDRRWPRFVSSIEVFTDERQVQWNVRSASQPVGRRFFDWLAGEIPGSVAGPLEYTVGADRFLISGDSFFQVNRFLLADLVECAIGDAVGDLAWDLYAGVGLFSLPLARKFREVAAVESSASAAHDLARNLASARAVRSTTEDFLAKETAVPDFVLADPPRAGLGKTVVERLLEIRPRTLAIVACDPATVARDLSLLNSAYDIANIAFADLFPQTFHIETVARLTLR
jgi:23S rRNA (uracil1939-C5)-methyltransferase